MRKSRQIAHQSSESESRKFKNVIKRIENYTVRCYQIQSNIVKLKQI